MADTKISALPASTVPLAGTETLPIVQGGATVKATVASLLNGANLAGSFAPLTANSVFTLAGAADGSTTYQLTKNGATSLAITGSEYAAFGVNPLNIITYVYGDNAYSVAINNFRITKVTTTGHDVLIGDSKITNGNLVIGTAGKGIDFSADPSAAGMTSELLDDYEGGTWTATVKGEITPPTTPVTVTCTYTKIGRLVTVTGLINDADMTGASGTLEVIGLPFTPTVTSIGSGFTNMSSSADVSYIPSGQTRIIFIIATSGITESVSATTGRSIWFTVTYQT